TSGSRFFFMATRTTVIHTLSLHDALPISPYLKDAEGRDTSEAAYYLSTNRNKRSITIDIATPEGAETVRKMAAKCDILVENFKRSEEHTSELQSRENLVCRLLLEKKN